MKKVLVYDISNILFRVASVQKHSNPFAREAQPEDLVGLCMHISIQSIYRWYEKFRPDFVVFAFEGGNNWRKTYTAEVKARKQYKANRVPDPSMNHFYELIDAFYKTMQAHTSIACLKIDGMEGDDAIAGFCQIYAHPEREITIVSGDRDFIQLTKLPNVTLIDPASGKQRNGKNDKDYVEDLDYWIFLKCIRGDMGDYVPSAFPGVRETRLKKAFVDQYERANLMNETWVETIPQEEGDPIEKRHRVGDLFEQNVILLDLFKQPDDKRAYLLEQVDAQVKSTSTYNHFSFLRFLDKYQLNKLRDEAVKYVNLFSNNQRGSSPPPQQVQGGNTTATLLKSRQKKDKDDGLVIDMTKKNILEF